jgi:hypothetical protein
VFYVYPLVRDRGLKHASELNKGGGVKLWRTPGRALDFPLYVVFLDGTLDKYNASEAVYIYRLSHQIQGLYIDDNHRN